jgi:SET domain-containing protein
LEVRQTPDRGRGVFATRPIRAAELLLALSGWQARSADLDDAWFAMQLGPDLWLCSGGGSLDDCINHSCEPNAGFTTGEPVLFALRDIAAGAEVTWDYSTSLAEEGWTLDCRCQAPGCRKVVRAWPELTDTERSRLRPIALTYLREM